MCEFCEMIVVIRLFAWLKWAEWVVECWVLELETVVYRYDFEVFGCFSGCCHR